PAGVLDGEATREPVGRVHLDRAEGIVTEVLLHLCDEGARLLALLRGDLDAQCAVDLRELAREDDVDDDALDLDDLPRCCVRAVRCVRHEPPRRACQRKLQRAGARAREVEREKSVAGLLSNYPPRASAVRRPQRAEQATLVVRRLWVAR